MTKLTIVFLLLIILGPFVWVGVIQQYADSTRTTVVATVAFTCGVAVFLLTTLADTPAVSMSLIELLVVLVGARMYLIDNRIADRYHAGPTADGGPMTKYDPAVLVVGAAAEEVIYRWGLSVLLLGISPTVFVIVSSVTFGAHHYDPDHPLEGALKTVNGLVYAGVFLWSGSLLVAILCHVSYNVAYFLAPNPGR